MNLRVHMKRIVCLGLLLEGALPLHGQISTTVCDIINNPTSFNGKLVRIRAMRILDFEVSATRAPELHCVDLIWLDFGRESTNAQTCSGACVDTEAQGEDFKRFQELTGRVAA